MGYREIWEAYKKEVEERFPLVMERLELLGEEETVPQPYRDYFRQVAAFLSGLGRLAMETASRDWEAMGLDELKQENHALYQDILPENYGKSYGNPEYAVQLLGEGVGKLLSALYADIRALIPYAYEGRLYDITIFSELFVEIYNQFEEEELPQEPEIQQMIYWFFHDYGEVFTEVGVMSQTCPEMDFYTRIINRSGQCKPSESG